MNKYLEMISELENQHSSMFHHYAKMLKKSYEDYRENVSFLHLHRKEYQEHKRNIPILNKYNGRKDFVKSGRINFISIYGEDIEYQLYMARINFQKTDNTDNQILFFNKCKAILWMETCSLEDVRIIGEYSVNKDDDTISHIQGTIYLSANDIINVLAYRMNR